MRRLPILLVTLAWLTPWAQGQSCTENTLDGFNTVFAYGGGGNGMSIGQIFTACGSERILSITIDEDATSTPGAYDLWIAPETGGDNTAYTAGPPTEVIADPGGAFPRTTTLTLTSPYLVTAGASYRFVLNKAGVIDIRCTNTAAPSDYVGGEATDDVGIYLDFDLNFEVAIGPTCTVPAIPIWGEAALALLLLGSGLTLLRLRGSSLK